MAKARAIVKRRKAVQNIRKITRTMELIATARFKKAMDRASQAEAYTRKISQLVADLSANLTGVSHPLLAVRQEVAGSVLLVISSNRGLCGGYNANVLRHAANRHEELRALAKFLNLEVAGKRGINYFRFRRTPPQETYTHFEDKVRFEEVNALAERYIRWYVSGKIDRLDVAYTKFLSASRQVATVETLLPLAPVSTAGGDGRSATVKQLIASQAAVQYEFLPDAAGILAELLPMSFKVRLFKCFLDAAVSEQIARMVAMKGATENAGSMIRSLTMLYNRARQAQITKEIAEIVGGAEAIK
jgi:F-type H+-transporting ATPase subunit gamma